MSDSKIIWKLNDLCSKLSQDYKIIGNAEAEVTGLELNSKEVKPGYAFFCIVGFEADGHKFADNAVENGATCLFVEHELENIDVPQVIVKNTRDVMAEVADIFYGCPTEKFNVVGITGTNGKTTITNIISHVLTTCNRHCGLVGTNGIKIDGVETDSEDFKFVGRTTPEAFQLQKIMYEFKQRGINNIVMEVSSHAIEQNRIKGIRFGVTAFTNLTQDHLDYHKTMENYFEAKAKLFSKEYPAKRVICIDDEWGQKLYKQAYMNGEDVISVGLNKDALFNLDKVVVNFPLIGRFNQQNMLVAYGICRQLGFDHDEIVNALETMPVVEGRMQLVEVGEKKPKVFVDYCHTPDALQKAIETLKNDCNGKVFVVVGCGGDRDKDKRPKMGKIAVEASDYAIITSDNPRREKPEDIIDDIVAGIKAYKNYEVEVDRASAIEKAIKMAEAQDFVLLAGKGHEKYQEIGTKKHHFDDVEVALSALNN